MGWGRFRVLVVLSVAAWAAPASAGGVSCSYTAGVVTVTAAGGAAVVDASPAGEIRADGVPCGAATVSNTDLIAVEAGGAAVTLDTGALAPGAAPEPDGLAEVEVAWSGGGTLVVRGGSGPDDLRWTGDGVHVNGDADMDVTGAPGAVRLLGGDGADLLDLTAAPGPGAADGGADDDIVRGGAFADVLDGGAGADQVSDGRGADDVRGGDGDDLLLAGGTVTAASAGPLALPDSGAVSQSLATPALSRGTGFEVRLTLTHPDVSTLDLWLSRGGSTVSLTQRAQQSGSGLHGTVFADGAASMASGTAPYTGRFRPWHGVLWPFAGSSPQPLTLTVADRVADGHTGTLVGWSVTATGSDGADAGDAYDAGAGRDTLSYPRRAAVTVDAPNDVAGEAGEGDAVAAATVESYVTGWGDDTLTGTARDEELHGHYGEDTLRGNGGDDVYDCLDGARDVATFTGLPDPVVADLRAGTVTGNGVATVHGCEVVHGTDAADVITGSDHTEVLHGHGGDDVIASGGGYDEVYAGDGDDVVDEGIGWGYERDTVAGGAGHDLLTYAGRREPVSVNYPGPVPSVPHTYVDQDRVSGFEDITGGEENDYLYGDGGPNVVTGGGGHDELSGGDGDDVLDGGAGDDTFLEGATASGRDALLGGPGADLADYGDRALPLTITLDGLPGDGEPGEEDNADVEHVYGGQTTDVIVGNAAANRLYGWGGVDRITGLGGADRLDGGGDPDVIDAADGVRDLVFGDEGYDVATVDAADSVDQVEVVLPLAG